jgi:hypothetical protein
MSRRGAMTVIRPFLIRRQSISPIFLIHFQVIPARPVRGSVSDQAFFTV